MFPSKRLQVNGIALNVVDIGEGEPVLMVHGFPDTHAVWRKQIPALVEAGYRVIVPDTRGCGDSDVPANVVDYHVDRLVGDLVALLDVLGLEKVKLVAHDWGAVTGWRLVIAHPQRIDGYVALSVGHPSAYGRAGLEQKLRGYYILLFQLRGFAEWLLRVADWSVFRWCIGYTEEVPRWKATLARPGRLTAALNYYRANVSMILPREYPHARVPVTAVYSDGDRFLTEGQMTASACYCDGSFEYIRVAGANHWLQLHAPEKVTPLILEALGRWTCDAR
jgi:pimeloyl-ACP methyl ester carboxylesterase